MWLLPKLYFILQSETPSEVWSQIELLHCRRLLCDDIDHQLSTIKSSQLRLVLFAASIHGGAVYKGRELVELLPGVTLAHGGRADKVKASHSDVNPGVERVPRGNRDVETSRIVRSGIFTAI